MFMLVFTGVILMIAMVAHHRYVGGPIDQCPTFDEGLHDRWLAIRMASLHPLSDFQIGLQLRVACQKLTEFRRPSNPEGSPSTFYVRSDCLVE